MVTRLCLTLFLLAPASAALAQVTPPIPHKSSGITGENVGKKEFERALALYQAGKYLEARPLFEEAYAYSDHRPTTIRALAQCERMLENDPRAIELFQEYLQTGPDDAPEIVETIATLEARHKARLERLAKPVSAAPAAPPPPPPELVARPIESAPVAWAPIATSAAGAALVAGGVVLFTMGRGAADNVEGAAPGTSFSAVREDVDRAPTLMTAGTIAGGAGLVALGAGIVWWVTSGEDE